MTRTIDGKFHSTKRGTDCYWYEWERTDRIQEYKGIKIYSITYYNEFLVTTSPCHRKYEWTINGETHEMKIDKRGGNIDFVKWSINRELKK